MGGMTWKLTSFIYFPNFSDTYCLIQFTQIHLRFRSNWIIQTAVCLMTYNFNIEKLLCLQITIINMFHTESEIFIKRTLVGFLEFCVVVFIIIILSKMRTMPKYHLVSSLLWKFLTISSWHACKSKWLWIILSIFYDLFSI